MVILIVIGPKIQNVNFWEIFWHKGRKEAFQHKKNRFFSPVFSPVLSLSSIKKGAYAATRTLMATLLAVNFLLQP